MIPIRAFGLCCEAGDRRAAQAQGMSSSMFERTVIFTPTFGLDGEMSS
jgi:hypothetical protein